MHKIAIVTGANAGMGLATTTQLAKQGIHVVMACRNEARGQAALEVAKQDSQSEAIDLMICDLGNLDSIRSFASDFKQRYGKLDILVNNAGVVHLKREETKDGFEAQLGVNHLGHFLLTNLLIESLQHAEAGRIVVVSSGAHKWGKIHFDDPHLTNSYNVMKAYGQSKLANVLFTKELARRLKNSSVTVNAVHPGAVATSLGVNRNTGFGKRVMIFLSPFFRSPEKGASTAIYLATSPEVEGQSGDYYYNESIAPITNMANDEQLAKTFWEWSEKEVGL
ncbi:SDR family oxidoreductase [Pontibacillus yanchengensis]|uniref:Short-chain dehydrogenase n=1 Tax=Pontibacillus yanchengensis Y32 TaxID=1385514 RepID=A0A0A2TBV4_9BACI|nr:SDR family oxidoreductase [Pontibacillus yanchengensis]KGP71571.1 short-chain dehydrogenase [Pontibacillus yanchengensis Y32]